MRNNPTGAMGLPDYLGWGWRTGSGVPIVCLPGCPAQPDNMTSVLLELVQFIAGVGPAPALDDKLRPARLFGQTVREGCGRAGFTEQGLFAKCNVPARGWVNGIGGCPNVGGICIGCTMPGFPDKFMPFMDPDPWGNFGANVQRFTYGPLFRYFRKRNLILKFDEEPVWRTPQAPLSNGYKGAAKL
jgi:hydrogenase small subunit